MKFTHLRNPTFTYPWPTVQSGQVLNLDRPWRERRDMLSGILTAASVVDRRKVVENLDRRFEQHAEIDDFEIASGLRKADGFPRVPRVIGVSGTPNHQELEIVRAF